MSKNLRNYISSFLNGQNINALINAIQSEINQLHNNSENVYNQLSIVTASKQYLINKINELYIPVNTELGFDDNLMRQIGITVGNDKKIAEVINQLLEFFYGKEVLYNSIISSVPEPYNLSDGYDLQIILDNNPRVYTITFNTQDFNSISSASANEVASVINNFFYKYNIKASAVPYINYEDNNIYLQLYASSAGQLSSIKVIGGEAQKIFQFPNITPINTINNNTIWQITKINYDYVRLRWIGGDKPPLNRIQLNDYLLLYGTSFKNIGLSGTFKVANVMTAFTTPVLYAGYIDIYAPFYDKLLIVPPNSNPPPNTPTMKYSYMANNTSSIDILDYSPLDIKLNQRSRYALMWNLPDLLEIYIPVTSRTVNRLLNSGYFIQIGLQNNDFKGIFGSNNNINPEYNKIQVINDYIIKYYHKGKDNLAINGIFSYISGAVTVNVDISYIKRENNFVIIVCKNKHLLPITIINGVTYTDAVITVDVNAPTDIQSYFNGFIHDRLVDYDLSPITLKLKQNILNNAIYTQIQVAGYIEQNNGYLIFNLAKTNQEIKVPFNSTIIQGVNTIIPIISIIHNNNILNVKTQVPHLLLPSYKINLSNTQNSTYDGVYTVLNVIDEYVFQLQATFSDNSISYGGNIINLTNDINSIIFTDPLYVFKNTHNIDSDIHFIYLLNDMLKIKYSTYITGTSEAREFIVKLLKSILAVGIKLKIVLLYPSDIYLGENDLRWIYG